MNRPLRIMSLPVDDGGCGNYRVRQPLRMIKEHTEHDVHIIDMKKDDMTEVTKALSIADIAIVRQGGEEGMRQMRSTPEFKHLKWVLDIDDNIELISPYSEHYGEYGTKEFTDPDTGKKIWEDGVTFDLAKNRHRVASLLKGMKEADLVTVTTEKLAEYARAYNPNVAILPNLIDTDLWWPLSLKPKKRLRIGWAGGVSHYEDLYSVKDAINTALKEVDCELYMVGAHFPGLIEPNLRDRVHVLPWTAFQAHSYRMMCLALDVAIIPLVDLPFNHYKSPIKFLEFSAMGVPSVVSNVTPYKEEIAAGVNAIAFQTPEQATIGLLQLLASAKERTRIAQNAVNYVRPMRSAKAGVQQWVEAYRSLLTE